MRSAQLVFARCTVCTHAALTRASACAMCGGEARAEAPPADLYTGWRCECYQCQGTPC